jgi:hypothetical protein
MLSRIMYGVLFAIPIVLILTISCNNLGFGGKENSLVNSAVIPPLDTHAPTVTETATFALG